MIREHALFRRLETPAGDSAQGGCYIYHSTGPCIDTGVLVEFEGNLTIGLAALYEMCGVAGWSVNQEAEELEAENAFLVESNRLLIERVTEAENHLEAVGLAMAHAQERGARDEAG